MSRRNQRKAANPNLKVSEALVPVLSEDQSAFERQIEDLVKIPNKYIFESADFDHLADLEYQDIFNHVFNRFQKQEITATNL
jgi:hypothetical protein